MADITDRLRGHVTYSYVPNSVRACMDQAAAEIEQLRSQLAARDGEIADWLMEDAARTRRDITKLHANKSLTIAQTETWEALLSLKIGLAEAIKRGDYSEGK